MEYDKRPTCVFRIYKKPAKRACNVMNTECELIKFWIQQTSEGFLHSTVLIVIKASLISVIAGHLQVASYNAC